MPEKEKYVLLSDVIGSRHIGDRKAFERKLALALKGANTVYADALEGGLAVWKGLDETAAIVKRPEKVYSLMNAVSAGIAPHKMRFVLAKGEVDLPAKGGDVSKADGAVFHTAAGLMAELKKKGFQFDCATGDEKRDTRLRTEVNLLLLVKQGWTEQQHRTYRQYVAAGSQDGAAKKLKISQQAVSKTLKSINAYQVDLLEEWVQAWMENELTNG